MSRNNLAQGNEFRSRAALIPGGNEFNALWRLLNNIQSTNDDALSILVSDGGIVFQPSGFQGTPFQGSISSPYIVIGADRGSSNYKFVDVITIGINQLFKTQPEQILLFEVDDESESEFPPPGS